MGDKLAYKKVLRKIQPVRVQGLLIDQQFFVPSISGLESLDDPTNPKALVNAVNDKLKLRLRELCAKDKMFPDESTVRRFAGYDIHKLIRLKYAFFEQFCEFQDTNGRCKIKIENVINGICAYSYWYKIEENDLYLAWVMSPPTPWHLVAKDMLHELFYRMRAMLMRSLKTDPKSTKLEISAVKAFRELAEFLMEAESRPVRYNLAVIEKKGKGKYHKVKSLDSAVGDLSPDMDEEDKDDRTADEIEKELAEIEKSLVDRGSEGEGEGETITEDSKDDVELSDMGLEEGEEASEEEDVGGDASEGLKG